MKKIAVFASGGGSNAQKIIAHFAQHPDTKVVLVLSNKADAGVLDIAHAAGVATRVFNRQEFYETRRILEELQAMEIDFLVLAGFLWLAPSYLVQAFPGRIVNIHPALLPQYGGKGMYGMHVHEAVKAAGEKASGMSIHFVDEHYDEGNIIFQVKCSISDTDTAADIAAKVLTLEHRYYAGVIENEVRKLP